MQFSAPPAASCENDQGRNLPGFLPLVCPDMYSWLGWGRMYQMNGYELVMVQVRGTLRNTLHMVGIGKGQKFTSPGEKFIFREISTIFVMCANLSTFSRAF